MLVTGVDIGRDSNPTDSKIVLTTVVTSRVFMANPGAATAPPTTTTTATSTSTVQPS